MSTQTKIKGHFENDNLPVLTADGLLNQYYNKYILMLEEVGYELTEEQKQACVGFLDGITNNNLSRHIKTIFPFIGTDSNKDAALIPMMGEKILDFNSSSSDLFGLDGSGNIIGIKKSTATTNLKLGDLISSVFIGFGGSLIKGDLSDVTETKISKPINSNMFQIRLGAIRGLNGKSLVGSAYRNTDWESGDLRIRYIGGNKLYLENTPSGGAVYFAGLYGNPTGVCEYLSDGSDVIYSHGSQTSSPEYIQYLEDEDLDLNLNNSSLMLDDVVWTSIVFFKDMMSESEMQTFMGLLKDFMTGLGRQ